MADDQDRSREADYRTARSYAAAGLTCVTILLLVLDAVLPDYDVDPVILGLLLGTVGALLGVEVLDALRRPRG